MSHLFTPLRIGELVLQNRIIIAPMCQYSAVEGSAADWHLIHLGHLSLSGASLMMLEATAVSPQGRISAADLGLYSDANQVALAQTLTAIRRHSPIRGGIQLAHAGRKASCLPPWEGGAQLPPHGTGWQTLAPSPLSYAAEDVPPEELQGDGLQAIRRQFESAARRAAALGFDAIEVHAAHGYLLHQFLSPLSNQRSDAYGGSLENRMRFPLEIFETVRAAVPSHIPVWARISATDWVSGGWDLDSSLVFARALAARGSAAIHVSSGGLSPLQKIEVAPGYQVPFAEHIKRETRLTTIAVGLITEPEHAESILAEERADAIALARAMLYDPRWPWHAAAKLGDSVYAPRQYLRSQPTHLKKLLVAPRQSTTGTQSI